jgi:hypothetical protein
MESKAQKAALAAFKEAKANLLKDIKNNTGSNFSQIFVGEHWAELSSENLYKSIERLALYIKEYGLEERLIADTVKEVHDLLMNRKDYEIAAAFAKKYGL